MMSFAAEIYGDPRGNVSAPGRVGDARPRRLPNAEIHQAYLRANRRLLIFDYDGTLVPFADNPQRVVPSPNVVRLLSTLAAERHNVVALISGRRAQDLDRCSVLSKTYGSLRNTELN